MPKDNSTPLDSTTRTTTLPVRIAFVGFGLIGQERYKSITALATQGRSVVVSGIYDPFLPPEKVPQGVQWYKKLSQLYNDHPDWLFVAVPHDDAATIAIEALQKGLNVLIEKPLGRTLAEAERIVQSIQRPDQLWVGFNFRFYDGIAQAIADVRNGLFGEIISINMLMGHGCSPDITKGWKLDPVKAGGGCLIDPGIHLLDLCREFSSNKCITVRGGWAWKGFWNTGIEEECHLLLDSDKMAFNVQVSIVRWRSTFRIEINGTEAYGVITGRNRSYGTQRYIVGPRWGWQQAKNQEAAEQLVVESDGNDVFTKEIDALLFPSERYTAKPCSSTEAIANMKLLGECRSVLGLTTSLQ